MVNKTVIIFFISCAVPSKLPINDSVEGAISYNFLLLLVVKVTCVSGVVHEAENIIWRYELYDEDNETMITEDDIDRDFKRRRGAS